MRICLLQAELLSRRQESNRLSDSPVPCLRSLGSVNPDDEITPLSCGERLKESPDLRVAFESLRDVRRQFWDRWPRRVRVRGGSRHEPWRREEASRLQVEIG